MTEELTKFSKAISYWLSEKGFPDFIITTILAIIFFSMSTLIHETGHYIFGWALGCQSAISHLDMITGTTTVMQCAQPSLIVIALAGPLFAFFIGLWLWFSEPNGRPRMLALIMLFLSATLQLYPQYPLDMGKAIEWGLNPILGWLIFIIVLGISFNLIIAEITEYEPWEKG